MLTLDQITSLFSKLQSIRDGDKRIEIINEVDERTAKVLFVMATKWNEVVISYAFEKGLSNKVWEDGLPEQEARELACQIESELYVRTTGKDIEQYHWEDKELSVIHIAYAYMIQSGELDLAKEFRSKENGYRKLALKHGFMSPKMAKQFKNRIIHYSSAANRKGIKNKRDVLSDLLGMISPAAFQIAKKELLLSFPDYKF